MKIKEGEYGCGVTLRADVLPASASAVLTTVSASYPALTIFLAVKHLNEKNKMLPLAGAFITIIGIIVLSI